AYLTFQRPREPLGLDALDIAGLAAGTNDFKFEFISFGEPPKDGEEPLERGIGTVRPDPANYGRVVLPFDRREDICIHDRRHDNCPRPAPLDVLSDEPVSACDRRRTINKPICLPKKLEKPRNAAKAGTRVRNVCG